MDIDACQIDRLSDLPDALLVSILSLLATRMAARTSILARRFRYLWEASPSLSLVDLIGEESPDVTNNQSDSFIDMADRALLCRDPSLSVLSFRLKIPYFWDRYSHSFIFSLLVYRSRINNQIK